MTRPTTDSRRETATQAIAQAADARERRDTGQPVQPSAPTSPGPKPMLPRGGEKAARLTVSLPPDDIAALKAMADSAFAGNTSTAALWSIRFAVLALASDKLKDRRIGSPADALAVLG